MLALTKHRIAAFFIDYVIISGYILLLVLVGIVIYRSSLGDKFTRLATSTLQMDVLIFVTTVLPVGLYFTIFEAQPRNGTPGKKRMKLKVVSIEESEGLSYSRVAIRNGLKLLPWQIAHMSLIRIPGWPLDIQDPSPWVVAGLIAVWVLVIGYVISIFMSRGQRAIYDVAAGVKIVSEE